MKQAVVVVPTYNENGTIKPLILKILAQEKRIIGYTLSVVIVDDNSPDGTASSVQEIARNNFRVHLLKGIKKSGLGNSYKRGMKYALSRLHADVIFEMDADFSHDPAMIPLFLHEIETGSQLVIGSRFIMGGSTPRQWPLARRLNSKLGNICARFIGGLSQVKDCTSGYRAISASILKQIPLDSISSRGFAFQIELLSKAASLHAIITEIPIHFQDRVVGTSKLGINDIFEFIVRSYQMRFPFLKHIPIVGFIWILAVISYVEFLLLTKAGIISYEAIITIGILLFSLLMIFQGVFNLLHMLYAWDDPAKIDYFRSPTTFEPPKKSFTAIVPARSEEHVIADTIKAMDKIDYPQKLKELIVVCRFDDKKTIDVVTKTIESLGRSNIKLVIFNDFPINKPHALNIGLAHAQHDVIVVFDAEDEPHPLIYKIINTVMLRENASVVQSGVQLMNHDSKWFSTLNVLEYFFWFKSSLQFFAKAGLTPLGGNTVFFSRKWLSIIHGWDEACLTEDADIGLRLSKLGAKIRIVYDEQYVTKEETPPSISSFIKQRTRWDQGFLQVLNKGEWRDLPTLRQKLLALYILLIPEMQALFFLSLPLSLIFVTHLKLPIIVAIISSIPFYLLLLQFVIFNIGFYEFTKAYGFKYKPTSIFKILITFIPFQLLLGFAASRALLRTFSSNITWEKTLHINAHRDFGVQPAAYV